MSRTVYLLLVPALLFCLATAATLSGWCQSVPAAAQESQATAALEDLTDKLVLKPGLSVTYPIFNGLDTRWKTVGDYEFAAHIVKCGAGGLTFDWDMSAPADTFGRRTIRAEDLKRSERVSLFYPDKETCIFSGYTCALRISDFLYQAIKSGQRTSFGLDGPEIPPGYARARGVMPRAIQAVGQEYVAVQIDGKMAKVRTIKATTDNGWNYWIMDKPDFPMLVAGNGPFAWGAPRFSTSAAADVIKQLKEKGEATTYAILFDFDKAVIKSQSKPILDDLGSYLTQNPDLCLEVQGHTDNFGTAAYNILLSQRRSAAVKSYLVWHCGIKAKRLTAHGFGLTRPLASNSTTSGRAKNRRVVFKKI